MLIHMSHEEEDTRMSYEEDTREWNNAYAHQQDQVHRVRHTLAEPDIRPDSGRVRPAG